jgi:WD40 repeat protein
MQSIKNTSAQIVNKAQNHNSNLVPKHQATLNKHRDGIWDINCISIPNHLLNNINHVNYNEKNFNVNYNLLIGTASADTTARLWYLNSLSQQQANHTQNQLSPIHHPNISIQTQQMVSTAFCIQEYCGHTGMKMK